MRNLSITARMLIVALAPAVLVAALLTLWFLVERVREVERSEMRQANALAEGLVLAGEYGVATANGALLEDIARPTLSTRSVVAVRFADDQDRTLYSSGEPADHPKDAAGLAAHFSMHLFNLRHIREVERTVLRTDLSLYDDPLFAATGEGSEASGAASIVEVEAAGRRIGALQLTVDLSAAYHRQIDSIDEALLVTLLVLIAATPAAVWLARGVSRPVRDVTEAMGRLARHDYVEDYPPAAAAGAGGSSDGDRLEGTGGELGELARGVRHLSAELRSFHARLQDSARVATDDLGLALDALERRNRELDEARASAERASAFKSEFLANMSHEIRTPMNTIVGTLSTLIRSPLDRDQAEQVTRIERASGNLLALIDDILDITRIETGNLRVQSEPCELEEVLETVFHGAARHAVERGIEFRVAPLPAEVPASVLSDPLRLGQVLSNLVSNAIKFTASGHVLVEVSVHPLPTRAPPQTPHQRVRAVRFAVTDTGIGIPAHLQSRLFAAFEQADMSTSRHYGGAGLGLHICRGIVELMGGDIRLESRPGRGSRFEVELPLGVAEPSGPQTAVDAPSLALRLIDHYPPLEPLERHALARAGVALVDADAPASPAEAAATLFGVPNRLLGEAEAGSAAELSLPELDGPRLALVDLITPDTRRWLRAAGFDGHVLRAPRPDTLRRGIERALHGTRDGARDGVRDGARDGARGGPHAGVRSIGGTLGEAGFGAGDAPERRDPDGSDGPGEAGRSPSPSSRVRRPHVLAVDDQRMNLELLARYFEHLDVDGALARSDAEAERELEEHRFDLVLLDLHMPGRDGFEIVRRLRASGSRNRTTPVVALTADAYAESHARALASGFDAVLTKPLTIERMRVELERWAGDAETAPPPVATPANGTDVRLSTERATAKSEARRAPAADMVSIAACAAGMLDNTAWAVGAIGTYRDEIPLHVETLRGALSRHDRGALGEGAHALKGVSDICRVAAVAEAARTLELAAETDDWGAIATHGETLLDLLGIAAEQCERELAGAAVETADASP